VSNEAIGSLPVEKKIYRNRNAQKASSIANTVFYLHTLHGQAFCMAFGQSKPSSSNVGYVVDEIAEYEMYEQDCGAHVASTKWLEWPRKPNLRALIPTPPSTSAKPIVAVVVGQRKSI